MKCAYICTITLHMVVLDSVTVTTETAISSVYGHNNAPVHNNATMYQLCALSPLPVVLFWLSLGPLAGNTS